MRIHLRPPIPGGRDHELMWGSLLLIAALLGAAWLSLGLPTPLCPLHALSGIPCPTCGATRAAEALLHGDVNMSVTQNPLITAAVPAAALYVGYAAVVVIGRLPRFTIGSITTREARMMSALAIILIAANWAYLLWRGF